MNHMDILGELEECWAITGTKSSKESVVQRMGFMFFSQMKLNAQILIRQRLLFIPMKNRKSIYEGDPYVDFIMSKENWIKK